MRVEGIWAAAKHVERKSALTTSCRVRIGWENVELSWQEREVVVDDGINALDWRLEKLVGPGLYARGRKSSGRKIRVTTSCLGNCRASEGIDRSPWREDELVFENGLRRSQAATSRSSAGLLWMIKVEPFSSTMSFFLNSDSVRVIVSPLVPVS